VPAITALLHTENDALRLGRCLETLYPCDHILVVDHGSRDDTVALARDYGARVTAAVSTSNPAQYLRLTDPGWIFCLDPRESVSESLAADLYEWKLLGGAPSAPAFSVLLRQEGPDGWVQLPHAQTRLIPADWNRWDGFFPQSDPRAVALEGELLRFTFP
jgi:hypothetical protein